MRDSSWLTSSSASSQVASRNGSYHDGGVATRSRMSMSSRSSSGSSRSDLPTERGGPAGLALWPSRSIVCHGPPRRSSPVDPRSEEHTSELQSRLHLVCRLLLEKKKKKKTNKIYISTR